MDALPAAYEEWTDEQLHSELWNIANQMQDLADSVESIANILLSRGK